MTHLAVASLLWAFSFGLISAHLVGVPAVLVATLRLGASALLFLPLLRLSQVPRGFTLRLVLLGVVQYGVMYVLYIESYRHLAGHEVALLTALTPLHVLLIDGALRGRIDATGWLGVALAVGGACVIAARPWAEGGPRGVLLVQGANLCFALGQVLYARWAGDRELDHKAVFALPYLGATLFVASLALVQGHLSAAPDLSATQWWSLAYLGLAASGLGFFLWNVGASRVRAGTLAVFNNVKVPLAVIVSLTIFHEDANVARLATGSLFIGAGLGLTLRRSR